MRRRTRLAPAGAAAALLLAAATAATESSGAAARRAVLVSFDGFRASYWRPGAGALPTLDGLAARGASGSLKNAFITKTFPNHFTLVTGRHEETHGVVANRMIDARRPGEVFTMRTHDAFWWDGGEPVWITAELQGTRAATFFWPGSETELRGVRPTHWFPYNGSVPYEQRVDTVLKWLENDSGPRMITLYFEEPDHTGHEFGPDSPEIVEVLRTVDTTLARLLDGIDQRGLRDAVDVIVTSDHGMAATSRERVIDLHNCVDTSALTFSDYNPVAAIWPKDDADVDKVVADLRACSPHLTVWRKDEIPTRLHYRDNRRIAPIIAAAELGWAICKDAAGPSCWVGGGTHGYDTKYTEMHPLFVAAGPSFRSGVTDVHLNNTDVYPLLCEILGLEPAAHNGSLSAVRPLLVATPGGDEDSDDAGEKMHPGFVTGFGLGVFCGVMLAFGGQMIYRSFKKPQVLYRTLQEDSAIQLPELPKTASEDPQGDASRPQPQV